MKPLLCLLAVLILSVAVFAFTPPGYRITGTVTGLPDTTWLYLQAVHPDKVIDSCKAVNGRFRMKGRITAQAAYVVLRTAQYKNHVFFWLQNTNIRFSLQAGEFKKGAITGSATQKEYETFVLLSKPLRNRIDSLSNTLAAVKEKEERKSIRSQIKNLEQEITQLNQGWIKAHPNSIVAAHLLNTFAAGWGKETTEALYTHFSDEIKTTKYGREINDYITLNKDIRLGGRYADFEQTNAVGKMVRLSNIKAKYILLDFWASWCGPCREENPNLVKTYARFKDRGFAVLGVSLDENKSSWIKAMSDDKLTWENVADLRGDKNRAALMYGIHSVPTNFLIDTKGIIVAQDLRGQALDDKLKELLP